MDTLFDSCQFTITWMSRRMSTIKLNTDCIYLGHLQTATKLYSNRVTSDKKRIHTPPLSPQRAKKVVSDSPGLVDFAIGLLNSVINLPNRQVKFFEKFKLQKNCEINLLIKTILGLAEMMFGLVNVSFSLPEW